MACYKIKRLNYLEVRLILNMVLLVQKGKKVKMFYYLAMILSIKQFLLFYVQKKMYKEIMVLPLVKSMMMFYSISVHEV